MGSFGVNSIVVKMLVLLCQVLEFEGSYVEHLLLAVAGRAVFFVAVDDYIALLVFVDLVITHTSDYHLLLLVEIQVFALYVACVKETVFVLLIALLLLNELAEV